jgi:hypothetical protein
MSWSYNPKIAVTTLVWANPRSLATTYGITFVFFSSGYLDVSVLRVRSYFQGNMSSTCWVAPFGHLRINSYVPIPAAFRSLSRPSSPLRAKAFPMRSSLAYCTFCSFNELLFYFILLVTIYSVFRLFLIYFMYSFNMSMNGW